MVPNPEKGIVPISSSAIPIKYPSDSRRGAQPEIVPKEATLDDIKQIIQDYRSGAERAKRAGFDGI